MQARFDEAVQLAEQAFIDELSKLIEHLTERLSRHRGRQAEDLPRLGGRQPAGVLSAVQDPQRPARTSSSTNS